MNPTGKSPHIGTWKPITLEHINVEGENPLTFNTKKSLQDYCSKHKLRAGALGNDA
jgi:hypothetical protein